MAGRIRVAPELRAVLSVTVACSRPLGGFDIAGPARLASESHRRCPCPIPHPPRPPDLSGSPIWRMEPATVMTAGNVGSICLSAGNHWMVYACRLVTDWQRCACQDPFVARGRGTAAVAPEQRLEQVWYE